MKIAKVSAREKNKRTPHTASITSNQEHSKIGVDGNKKWYSFGNSSQKWYRIAF